MWSYKSLVTQIEVFLPTKLKKKQFTPNVTLSKKKLNNIGVIRA